MRSYAQLVSAGKQAARSQWTLGDLANEVETSYADHTMQNFADDIGVNLSTLQNYRTVAAAYEKSRRRDNLPWSVHQTFAALDDRYELLEQRQWTTAEARSEIVARAERDAQEANREAREAAELLRHQAEERELERTQEREEAYRRSRERQRAEEAARAEAEEAFRQHAEEAARAEAENAEAARTEVYDQTALGGNRVVVEVAEIEPVISEPAGQEQEAEDHGIRERRLEIYRRLSQICDILQDIRDENDVLTGSENQVLGAAVQFTRRLADGIQKNTQ